MTEREAMQSQTFVLPVANIDTDQIYPARYLTTTEQAGLGQYCFLDWREQEDSRFYDAFQAFDPERQRILVAGENFGCGSSREHAVWSLMDLGFEAVISTRFGDIFQANALKNGLLPVTLEERDVRFLMARPRCLVRIDLQRAVVSVEGLGERSFPLDRFAALCLIEGIDPLEFLLRHENAINRFEFSR